MRRHSFALALTLTCALAGSAAMADSQSDRGAYLVTVAGCGDCHTPGYFLGKPDMSRMLGGSDVGFTIPGLGAFVGRNLTPDKETGLGSWTSEQMVTAITTGVRPDGRVLAPIMPWHTYAHLTPDDVNAIVAYLKTIPPVKHAVPGPFGPNDTPTSLVFVIVPGDVYAAMPKPPPPK